MRKWKEKWTGPWKIVKHLNNTTTIIMDPESGNEKRVSLDRLKLFKDMKVLKYDELIHFDEDYKAYQKQLLKTLSNYNVKLRSHEYDLDYTKRSGDQDKIEED